MPRTHFEQALNNLHQQIVAMSLLAEDMLKAAMHALKTRNPELARQVMESDDEVDRAEVEIEKICISLLTRQQPLAKDLRQVMSVVKMTTDIERIADQAADICELMAEELEAMRIAPPDTLYELSACAAQMAHEAIHAYVHQDEEQARRVIQEDETADGLYAHTLSHLQAAMREQPEEIGTAMKLAFAAKYLERIADHATNIAEWAIYRITGEILLS